MCEGRDRGSSSPVAGGGRSRLKPTREHESADGLASARRQPRQGALRQDPGLRVLGTAAAVLTLAAVIANVVWFARRGLGPVKLLAIAGPLWLAVAAVIGGAAMAAWLVGRLLSARGPKG